MLKYCKGNYLQGNEHLLMFKPDEENAYVMYADDSFYEVIGRRY